MDLVALSNGEVILVVTFAAIPFAVLAFALGAGQALREIGKGPFAVEFERDLGQKAPEEESAADREAREDEIRQMVEAKAYRQTVRGESPLDVDAEVERLVTPADKGGSLAEDAELREEVRQLVVARNDRRARRGKEPLDVEAEIERQLRELESLGQ